MFSLHICFYYILQFHDLDIQDLIASHIHHKTGNHRGFHIIPVDKGVLDDIKQDRSKMVERQKEDNSAAYYFTVVCNSSDEKNKLMAKMGCQDYEEIVPASSLFRLVNADLSDLIKVGTHEPGMDA